MQDIPNKATNSHKHKDTKILDIHNQTLDIPNQTLDIRNQTLDLTLDIHNQTLAQTLGIHNQPLDSIHNREVKYVIC